MMVVVFSLSASPMRVEGIAPIAYRKFLNFSKSRDSCSGDRKRDFIEFYQVQNLNFVL